MTYQEFMLLFIEEDSKFIAKTAYLHSPYIPYAGDIRLVILDWDIHDNVILACQNCLHEFTWRKDFGAKPGCPGCHKEGIVVETNKSHAELDFNVFGSSKIN